MASRLANWVKVRLMKLEDENERAARIEQCARNAELKAETALSTTLASHARVIAAVDKLESRL